jgi:hypothetical protein
VAAAALLTVALRQWTGGRRRLAWLEILIALAAGVAAVAAGLLSQCVSDTLLENDNTPSCARLISPRAGVLPPPTKRLPGVFIRILPPFRLESKDCSRPGPEGRCPSAPSLVEMGAPHISYCRGHEFAFRAGQLQAM